jgi:hypothetical protein
MWTCKHCKKSFDFSAVSERGNHTRWCNKNPKRNNWNKFNAGVKRFGKLIEFKVNCEECNKLFYVKEREKIFPKKDQYFCSRSCANSQGGKAKVEKCGLIGDRSIAKKYYKFECAVCGENRVVDVHHIDENRDNNSPNNLIFLCPNHHALYHRNKDVDVINIIEGHGIAWGDRLICNENNSRVRIPNAPPYFL